MLKRDYPTQYCSVASTLEIIGERWTILILRDVFLGIRRFEDLQRDLGVARNILQARLERLLEFGILVKRPYQERPLRHEYRLTAKGADLWPVLVALLQWGDQCTLSGERPIILQHPQLWRRARRPPPLPGVRRRRHRHRSGRACRTGAAGQRLRCRRGLTPGAPAAAWLPCVSMSDDTAFLDATAQAALVRSGEVATAEVGRRRRIARIEKLNPGS